MPCGKKYQLAIILILLLAFVLRFYRVGNRWSVHSDSARDILVGREALKTKQFPLIGSFSSAGPFVFGPLFYWLVSLSYLPSLNLLILPWLLVGIISVIFVFVMAKCGEKLWGTRGAIILGLLGAVSPSQILRSLSLTQHTLVGISAGLGLLAFISYLKDKKSSYLFLMGASIGFGLSMHYQALNLLPFTLVIFLVPKNNLVKIGKSFLLLILGILIPSLPLLYWDSLQDWANLRNILDYFLIAQYRIYVPNRWLTYIFKFWPQFWASVAGGETLIGWLFIGLTLIFLAKKLFSGRLSKTTFWLAVIFFLQIVLFRYHRGERFEGYIIYFHPLILFFSAWTLENLSKKWPLPTLLLLIIIVFTSLKTAIPQIHHAQNQAPKLKQIVFQLKERFPEKKFSLYDFQLNSSAYSFGLAAFLDSENLIDAQRGDLIGVCLNNCPGQFPLISDVYQPSKVVDLSNLCRCELKTPSWYEVNPRAVFEDVTLWWKKEKLQSPFSLQKFILGKLGLER